MDGSISAIHLLFQYGNVNFSLINDSRITKNANLTSHLAIAAHRTSDLVRTDFLTGPRLMAKNAVDVIKLDNVDKPQITGNISVPKREELSATIYPRISVANCCVCARETRFSE